MRHSCCELVVAVAAVITEMCSYLSSVSTNS